MTESSTVATAGRVGKAGPAQRGGPRSRADAVRNRERIVAAAREVFVERGPAAPFDEIARRAGVANATLYRHFRGRRSLLHAVLLNAARRMGGQVEQAAVETTDPFAALERFLHEAVDERLGALCGLLLGKGEQLSTELSAQYGRVEAAVGRLVEDARRDGRIRADVGLHDVPAAMSLLARPLPGTDHHDADHHDADVHRRLQLLVNGLRLPTRARAEPLPARQSPRRHRNEQVSSAGR
ncbi:helix-turn-helix domain-containing protein [Streptomyces sp. NPDC026673]|uniref:TetR/AcrR family transcriptional regulator n=1 Tax=Streptomyces sp. NPDC026673 TaxID=3155724 RepID=UPI0033FEFB3F